MLVILVNENKINQSINQSLIWSTLWIRTLLSYRLLEFLRSLRNLIRWHDRSLVQILNMLIDVKVDSSAASPVMNYFTCIGNVVAKVCGSGCSLPTGRTTSHHLFLIAASILHAIATLRWLTASCSRICTTFGRLWVTSHPDRLITARHALEALRLAGGESGELRVDPDRGHRSIVMVSMMLHLWSASTADVSKLRCYGQLMMLVVRVRCWATLITDQLVVMMLRSGSWNNCGTLGHLALRIGLLLSRLLRCRSWLWWTCRGCLLRILLLRIGLKLLNHLSLLLRWDLLDRAAPVSSLRLQLAANHGCLLIWYRLSRVKSRFGSSMIPLFWLDLRGALCIKLRCSGNLMIIKKHGLVKLHVREVLHLLFDRLWRRFRCSTSARVLLLLKLLLLVRTLHDRHGSRAKLRNNGIVIHVIWRCDDRSRVEGGKNWMHLLLLLLLHHDLLVTVYLLENAW